MEGAVAGDLIGTIVDEVDFAVERGKIQEFARATYTKDLVHTDHEAAREAGADDLLATPTHSVVAGHHRDQRGFVDKLGLALERVVVGSVKWQYFHPLQAGDSVRGVRSVVGDERRESRRGGSMRMVTLETEFVDTTGETLLRQQEVLIEREER